MSEEWSAVLEVKGISIEQSECEGKRGGKGLLFVVKDSVCVEDKVEITNQLKINEKPWDKTIMILATIQYGQK